MAYVRQFFKVVKNYRNNIEFANYFILHDSSLDTCDKAAESFYPKDQLAEIKNKPYYGIFVRFLCSFGLKNYDGTPKSGWYEFVNQTESY